MIAFFLVALISVLVFSGMRLGIRSWERVEFAAEYNAELRLARDFLRRVLGEARPVPLIIEGTPYLVFNGNSQQLEFIAPLVEQVGIPGLYLLRLELVKTKLGQSLALRRWLLNPDVLAGTNQVPAWRPLGSDRTLPVEVEDQDAAAGVYGVSWLIEGLDEFEIAYFGLPEEDKSGLNVNTQGEWQTLWENRSSLPFAVRVHMVKAERIWPDLIVRLDGASPEGGMATGMVVPP